jgi:hypothetical protein
MKGGGAMSNSKTKGGEAMTGPKQYLTERQVGEITGRAVQTLRNDRFKRCGIPWIKFGGSVRYDLDDVIAYMESHKVKTSAA